MIGSSSKKKTIIEVLLDDKASSGLKKIGTSAGKAASVATSSFKAIGVAVAAVTAATGAATLAFVKMSERVGKFEGLSLGFARNFGDMESSLKSFREASSGMVSDLDLMQTANRAALLGVTSNVEELSGLMVTARLRGREMGMSMTQAFNDIVTGIGRGSPLILDNLGIKIPDALKEMMKDMGEAEAMQTLLNYTIQDGSKIAKEYGENIELTSSEKLAVLKSTLTNIKDNIMKSFIPALSSLVFDGLAPFLQKVQQLTSEKGLKALWKLMKEGDMTADFPFAEDGKIVTGLLQARSAVVLIADAWRMFRGDFESIDFGEFEKVVSILFGEGVDPTVVWNTILFKVREVRDWLINLKDTAVEVWDVIKGKILEVWEKLKGFWEETLKPMFMFWWDMIKNWIVPALKELWAVFKEYFNQFKGDGERTKEILKALVQVLGVLLVGAITAAIVIVGALLRAITGIIAILSLMKQKSTEAWDKMIDSLAKVINKFRDVHDWVQKVIDKIKAIPSKVGVNILGSDKRATGGVTSGGWTMVGERGAELVSLPRGSHVYNSEDSKEMVGGGGITINVNAPVTGVDNLKATILEAVNEATARQNRLANYNLL